MDPAGMLPELQALILLVDETFFFPGVLTVLALKRQKEGWGKRGVNQRADFSERFQEKLTFDTGTTILRTYSFDLFQNLARSWELFLMNKSDKIKSDFFIPIGYQERFTTASLQGRGWPMTERN